MASSHGAGGLGGGPDSALPSKPPLAPRPAGGPLSTASPFQNTPGATDRHQDAGHRGERDSQTPEDQVRLGNG